jgi:hypothetical protein
MCYAGNIGDRKWQGPQEAAAGARVKALGRCANQHPSRLYPKKPAAGPRRVKRTMLMQSAAVGVVGATAARGVGVMAMRMMQMRMPGRRAVVSRAGVIGEPKAYHRGWRHIDHARRRRRHIHHAGSRLKVDYLRRRHLNVHRSRMHHRRHGHHRGCRHPRSSRYRHGLGVSHGSRRRVHRLLRSKHRPDEPACHRANNHALGPAIAVVAANQPSRHRAKHRARGGRRPEHLRLGRTDCGERK